MKRNPISYKYYIKDHLGNNRVVADHQGNVMQYTHYYPYGGMLHLSTEPGYQKFKYNGKEYDTMHGLNEYDYGARQYAPAIARFTSMDPLCEKYYHISPYAYCGGNPVNRVDPDGDTILIKTKNDTYRYNNGKIYLLNGEEFTGNLNNYLKSVVKALSDLNTTETGKSLVSQLDKSKNVFTIIKGRNAFKPTLVRASFANIKNVQEATGDMSGSSGSGGTIFWNPKKRQGGQNLGGGNKRLAYIGLGHEMAHGKDSDLGLLYPTTDWNTYKATEGGVLKSEWRAVFIENQIRAQSTRNIPLREYYGIDYSTGRPVGIGYRLLDNNNNPINYQ